MYTLRLHVYTSLVSSDLILKLYIQSSRAVAARFVFALMHVHVRLLVVCYV